MKGILDFLKSNKVTGYLLFTTVGKAIALGAAAAIIGGTVIAVNINSQVHTVRFDSAGGTVIEEQQVKHGDTADKPDDPEKGGFQFVDWHLSGDIFDFSEKIKDDVILTAEWTPLEGTEIVYIKLDTAGGNLMAPIEAAVGYTISAPLTPVRDGYEFVEWQLNGSKYDFNTKITGEITLTAKWKESDESSSGSSGGKSKGNSSEGFDITASGLKSSVPQDLKWSQISGRWYLTGTDDIYIDFYEEGGNYAATGKRFTFWPPVAGATSADIATMNKSVHKPCAFAMYINITDFSNSSFTIEGKYKFYRKKNYPSHVETDVEKKYNTFKGTWYLAGYDDDVYVNFSTGTENGERVLNYTPYNLERVNNVPSGITSIISYSYYPYSGIATLEDSGWSYSGGYLYNSLGSKKLKFSKTPSAIPPSSVSLNRTTLNLGLNESGTLVATVNPDNATNKNVTWSCSDSGVARVDSNGTVTARGKGKATITVTTAKGNKTASCTVTVSDIRVSSVSINKSNISLARGDSTTLTATVNPGNATNRNVTWTSNDLSVAKVGKYDGRVTATGKGSAVITVTTSDGSYTATCNVTVTNPPLTADASVGYAIITGGTTDTGIQLTINAYGGTGSYSYYAELYKDGVYIGTTSRNTLFVSGHKSGIYKVIYTVRDSDGAEWSQTETTEISIS